MMRPTMAGVGGRARKHGICRALIPLPVAVSLCVTCFFFGLFWGRMPANVQPAQSVPLETPSAQQQQQTKPQQPPQESLRQQQFMQNHRKQQQEPQQQALKQQQSELADQHTEVNPPAHQQQVQQENLPPSIQQQQQPDKQSSTDHNCNQSPCGLKELQPPALQPERLQQHQQQQPEVQQLQQHQQQQQQTAIVDVAVQTNAAQPPQQQQQLLSGAPAAVLNSTASAAAAAAADTQQQVLACLQQSGLLQPLLLPQESGHKYYTSATYQILSWQPRIVVHPNFIDAARAQHISNFAAASLEQRPQRAEVKLRQGREAPHMNGKADGSVSSSVVLRRDDDPAGVLAWLEDKIAAVTLMPSSHGEAFHIQRFKQLAKMNDSQMADGADATAAAAAAAAGAAGQQQQSVRMAAMMIHLSDVEEGGELLFQQQGATKGDAAHNTASEAAACSSEDYKYKPRFGDAVLIYSMNPDQSIDPRALPTACPVHRGTKWVVTKWLHNKPVQQTGSL